MSSIERNIHPVINQILSRSNKEKLLKQHSVVVWMTGLSGSGKTTLALSLANELNSLGFITQNLDGDNIRSGINNNLGFSEADRYENIRRIAEVAKLFMNSGIICINSFISPKNEIRQIAKQIIGEENFIDVYVNATLEICEQRDVKGLYAKARKGEIKNFTGIDSPFEVPKSPIIEINTELLSVKDSVKKCLKIVLPRIKYCFTDKDLI